MVSGVRLVHFMLDLCLRICSSHLISSVCNQRSDVALSNKLKIHTTSTQSTEREGEHWVSP